MARLARFEVHARLDHAARSTGGTLIIDRASGVIMVRPRRRRRLYYSTVDAMAQAIVERTIKAELREKLEARKARKGRKARGARRL